MHHGTALHAMRRNRLFSPHFAYGKWTLYQDWTPDRNTPNESKAVFSLLLGWGRRQVSKWAMGCPIGSVS